MPNRELQEFHERERRANSRADIWEALITFVMASPIFVGVVLLFAKTFG